MTKARILVVEDESVVRRHIRVCLEQHDYAVVGETARGAEAVEMAAARQPDLVLMDIRLEGELDGIAAAEQIGQRGSVPVVYLTAYADDHTLARARFTEPLGYVLKPFEDRELLMVIEMALYKHAAERRLRESESRLAAILGSIADGVVATDAAGNITFINAAARALIAGHDQPPIGAHVDRVIRLCDPETRRPLESPAATVTRTGAAVSADDQWLRVVATQSELNVDYCATPIRDDRGATGAVWVFRDAGERKRNAQRLQLAQRMEVVGQLAGGLAHDVNNLLTVISGYCHLLRGVLSEPSPANDYIAEIDKAAERAGALTQQLLAFGRRQILKPRILDLNRVVIDVERMLQRVIGENIRIETALDPKLPAIKADPAQLEQVIVNLAVNARDAMPGGGTLTLRTATADVTGNDPLDPPDLPPGRYAALRVIDTGHGIEATVLERIFEPFFTTKEFGKGIGLGLSTVYGIVQQSGGHVLAQSTVGEGSSFTVLLPVVDAPLEPAAPVPVHSEMARGGETILVVEDDSAIRTLMTTVLEFLGYRVLRAANGIEALKLAAAQPMPVDLLATDLVMPEIGGRELARRLRQVNPGIKVLYMSGYASPDTASSLTDDPTPLLSKPFAPAALAEAIRGVLSGRPAGS